jgi:hypothetical protein
MIQLGIHQPPPNELDVALWRLNALLRLLLKRMQHVHGIAEAHKCGRKKFENIATSMAYAFGALGGRSFVAISMGCEDPLRHKVHFGARSTFEELAL